MNVTKLSVVLIFLSMLAYHADSRGTMVNDRPIIGEYALTYAKDLFPITRQLETCFSSLKNEKKKKKKIM